MLRPDPHCPIAAFKDGKTHRCYSVAESLRVSSGRTVQRQLLHLGELSSAQRNSWQRTIETLHEDGSRRQPRFTTDRDRQTACPDPDVVEVKLSSFRVKTPRRFSDCWVGTRLREQLGLRVFWQEQLGEQAGEGRNLTHAPRSSPRGTDENSPAL